MLVSAVLFAVPASAQQNTPAAINVTFAEVTQGQGDNSALGLYFNVNDANGASVDPGSARQAIIQLDSGQQIPAQVEEANAPISVVMVLDASGSMQAAADTMRRAAISAVDSLPDNTQFSIIIFNRQVPSGTAFTANKTAVRNEIALYQPARPSDANAGTCLFDATFAAIDKAREVPLPARRLVLLFTDGRDELIAGGPLDPCSAKTLDEVVARASDVANPVNVYGIGLTGSAEVAESELRRMADTSNGAAVFGNLQNLEQLFQQIVDSIKNQRVARGQICLPRGQHTATLLISMGQGATLADSISFVTTRECTPATATPDIKPEVNVESASFNPQDDTVTIVISAAGQDQIDRFAIQAVDRNGNTVVNFDQNAPIDGPIVFSVEGVPDTDLEITVRAIRRDGTTADDTDRNVRIPRPTLTPTRTPTFTPSPTITPTPRPRSANIDGIEYNRDTDEVIVNLLYRERQEINRVRLTVFNQANTRVALIEPTGLDDNITFGGRANSLNAGERYSLRVQALDETGNILAETTSEFIYTPIVSPTPSLTPSPTITHTPTAVVVGAIIEAVTFDAEQQQFILRVTYENIDLIDSIEIDILDSNGLLVDTIRPQVIENISYQPGAKLVGQQQYQFQIKAINNEGRIVDRQSRQVTDPRTLTPTPSASPTETLTPTASFTPSPTPVVVNLSLNNPLPDLTNFTIRVEFDNGNPGAVRRYEMQLVSSNGSNIVDQQVFRPSAENVRTINMVGVPTGEYELTLSAFDDADNKLDEETISFRWTQPEPTPTPAPPGLADRIRDNPILGVVVGLIVLLLIGLLFWFFITSRRERKSAANTSASLPSQTGAFIIPQMPAKPDAPKPTAPAAPRPTVDTRPAPNLDEPTMRPGAVEFATNAALSVGEATGGIALPTGYLTVNDSKDSNILGKTFPLNKSPYYIGRTGPRQNDLNIDGDKNLSRAHAELHYERERWYLVDPSSQLGTTVNNGERITGRIPLEEGDVIRLGGTTILTFTKKG